MFITYNGCLSFNSAGGGMFLKERNSGHMIEVIDVQELFNPDKLTLRGRYQEGEDLQDEETFTKSELVFLSDEALPKCWLG